jgi:xylan 1,4-beta-xylosidase
MKTTYENPILKGTYPDPSICRVGEDYYLVNSSFCYFPAVPIFHSKDLIHWTQIGHCLTRRSQVNLDNIPSALGIFAPTLRYHDGRFYMVTTLVGGGGNFYVWAEDPAGEWSDPVWLEQDGIDPSLFFEDGRVYLTSTGNPTGIYQSEIDLQTGKSLSEPVLIWKGMGGRYPEGPHLYKVGDYYYLMISEGGTEYAHRVTLARSKSPWGAFEPCPHNPIFTHMNHPQSPLQATGHADLVQDQTGRWWMVCLAIRPSEGFPTHHLGRETILVPVAWNDEGWLVVNEGNLADLTMHAETLPLQPTDGFLDTDDFMEPTLDFMWNTIRTSQTPFWSLTAREGWLRLVGNGRTLNQVDAPAFIGRRQQHLTCEVRALVDYNPQFSGDEAGLALYQNEDHHYELFITQENGQRIIGVRQRIGALMAVVYQESLAAGFVTLIIRADPKEYHFSYAVGGAPQVNLTTARTRYLSTEVAGGFTGVYVGMYAYGDTPADFDYFTVSGG